MRQYIQSNDGEVINKLMEDIGVGVNVESYFRVGKAKNKFRPMILQFASAPHRHAVQFNFRKLSGKKKWNCVSIVPDLTKLQCIEKPVA